MGIMGLVWSQLACSVRFGEVFICHGSGVSGFSTVQGEVGVVVWGM